MKEEILNMLSGYRTLCELIDLNIYIDYMFFDAIEINNGEIFLHHYEGDLDLVLNYDGMIDEYKLILFNHIKSIFNN